MRFLTPFVILGVIWIYRIFSPESSFPGFESDYGGHMALIYELFTKPTQMLVWPPAYNGIWLSHFLTWPFLFMGIDISKAMLLVFDASLVSTIASLFWLIRGNILENWQKLIFTFATVLIVPLGMTTLAIHGFYAQVISVGFFCPLLVLWIKTGFATPKNFIISLILLAGGSWSYPDAFMWLAPLLALSAIGAQNLLFIRRAIATFCLLGVVIIYFGQIKLMHLNGAGGRGYLSIFQGITALTLLCCASFKNKLTPPSHRILHAILIYFTITLTLTIYSKYSHGEVLYYARKNYYAVIYFLPILVFFFINQSKNEQTKWSAGLSIVAFIWISIGLKDFLRKPLHELTDHLLRARGSISAADQLFKSNSKKNIHCPKDLALLIIPPEPSRSIHKNLGSRVSRLIYSNLGNQEFDLSNFTMCWFGKYTGYIDAAHMWEKKYLDLSGKPICTPLCNKKR